MAVLIELDNVRRDFALSGGLFSARRILRAVQGVSLSVAVSSIQEAAGEVPVAGGVLLTVSGALARGHIDQWRAGRTIRAPAHLRRPSRYFNPGVADEELSLARRGTTLVGTVKSGALVEVVHSAEGPARVVRVLKRG